jgi:hypothetical protein
VCLLLYLLNQSWRTYFISSIETNYFVMASELLFIGAQT